MSQLFLIALRNLAQHRRRTLLLGGAIAGVTALLSFLTCLSSGIHATMLESATTLSTGHINVAGFYKVTAGQSAPVITRFDKLEEIARRALPDLDYIAPRGRGWAKMVSENGSMQVAIGGIDISREPGFRRVIKVVDGSLDGLARPGSIMIFQEQAKKLDVKVGDNLVLSALTPRGTNNTLDLRVAVIAQDSGFMSAWNVFVPDVSLRSLYQLNPDATGALHVYLKDLKRLPRDMELLRKAYADAGYQLMDREAKPFWQKFESVNREDWTGQKLDLTTWEEEMSFIRWAVTGVDGLMLILISVLLVIIAVGIMNSMWIAIRERTREIGTLRAIGMQRPRVLSMFVIEAFTLGTLGAAAGAVLGLAAAWLFNAAHVPVPHGARMFLISNTFTFAVDPGHIAAGMLVIVACTTVISVVPAFHAARLKPVTAMSHLG